MEWQLRRWLFMTWLSGDFIVEMHVHNLDMMNWLIGAHPVQCMGMGGRQQRTEPEFGDSFDHFAVEYEYPNGLRIEYMGCADRQGGRGPQRSEAGRHEGFDVHGFRSGGDRGTESGRDRLGQE